MVLYYLFSVNVSQCCICNLRILNFWTMEEILVKKSLTIISVLLNFQWVVSFWNNQGSFVFKNTWIIDWQFCYVFVSFNVSTPIWYWQILLRNELDVKVNVGELEVNVIRMLIGHNQWFLHPLSIQCMDTMSV